MKLRRIKHMLLRLSPEEKMAGIGAIVVLISAFMPWYSVVFLNEKTMTVNSFAGDLGVIGFVIFLLTAIASISLMSEHLNIRIPNFGHKKEVITLFLMGESAFLLLLTIAIYTKRSIEYTNAELRFGLYAALIGAAMGTFAAFAQIQKGQKKEVEAFFNHEEAEEEVKEVNEPNLEAEYPPIKNEEAKIEDEISQPIEQEKFFYEEDSDEKIITQAEPVIQDEPQEPEVEAESEEVEEMEEVEPETPIESSPEQPIEVEQPTEIQEDEEDVEIQTAPAEEEIPAAQEGSEEKEVQATTNQDSYFKKEAGIKVDMDSVRKVEPEKEPDKKEVANESMDFYNDL